VTAWQAPTSKSERVIPAYIYRMTGDPRSGSLFLPLRHADAYHHLIVPGPNITPTSSAGAQGTQGPVIAEFQSLFPSARRNEYLFPNLHPGRHPGASPPPPPPAAMLAGALPFPEPPTKASLASARRSLQAKRSSIQALTAQIQSAEAALAQLIRESRSAIAELEAERTRLEQVELATLAYLSPVRRLPQELVREIFMWCFEEHPCCAWVLAAVCTSWRKLALRTPLLWSKVSRVYGLLVSETV